MKNRLTHSYSPYLSQGILLKRMRFLVSQGGFFLSLFSISATVFFQLAQISPSFAYLFAVLALFAFYVTPTRFLITPAFLLKPIKGKRLI